MTDISATPIDASTTPADTSTTAITMVGVIGAGQMGRGMAQVFATADFKVTLVFTSADFNTRLPGSKKNAIALAKTEIMASLQKLQEKNILPTTPDNIMARIIFTEQLEEIQHCHLVVEAIVEDFAAKKNIYSYLKNILRNCPTTILASNTSALPIVDLQTHSPNPKNFLGLHFMNPAPLMPLVEIITTNITDPAHGGLLKNIVEKRLMKQAVILNDTPGFVLNRLLIPYLNEAVKLLAIGVASRDDIDKAMTLGAGYKIGPLALMDFIGLDTVLFVLQSLAKNTGQEHYKPAAMLVDLVQQGHLGRKTKKGFYDY